MTDPFFANAAMVGASSLLIQNSTRQIVKQAEQVCLTPLTEAQEYVAIGTFGILVAMLLLASVVIIRTTLDLFR